MVYNKEYPTIEYAIITDLSSEEFKGIHFLPDGYDEILKAYLYIFHLPRSIIDVKHILYRYWKILNNHSHVVLLIHNTMIDMLNMDNVALVLYSKNCKNEADEFSKRNKSILGSFPISRINTASLRKHWYLMIRYFSKYYGKDNVPCEYIRILEQNEINALPLFFLEHYLSESKDFFDNALRYAQFRNGVDECIKIYASIETHSKCDSNATEDDKRKIYFEAIKNLKVPLSITLPGISPVIKKNIIPINKITDDEVKAVKLLGIHSACATSGLIIEAKECNDDLFMEINNLELYCKNSSRVKNKYIWRTLRKIGRGITKLIPEEQISILKKTTTLSVFTDFPLGLAIIDPCTAPLCCYQRISYKNLTPLTHALAQEMLQHKSFSIADKCNILIIECLDKFDKIRKFSDGLLTDTINEIGTTYKAMNVFYEEADTIETFYNNLNKYNDIDILMISSHGEYNIEQNYAGICIGQEILFKLDKTKISYMPKVILLSACHIRPRGRGCYSIVDEFRRLGAIAVLGNYIPVDVTKNAKIMCRFLINIAETQAGRNSYNDILEVWQHVVSSNAILEIADSHPKIKKWLYSDYSCGISNWLRFTQIECVNRLTYQNTYTDTLKIIKDMSQGKLKPEYIDAILRNDDFFPESLFYEFNGYPEYIYLK